MGNFVYCHTCDFDQAHALIIDMLSLKKVMQLVYLSLFCQCQQQEHPGGAAVLQRHTGQEHGVCCDSY